MASGQRVSCSAQYAHTVINKQFKLQAVGWISQALGTQDDIHLTTFEHCAEFMYQPGPHLDHAIWILSNEPSHGSAEEPASNDGRCPNPEFSNSPLRGLIREDAGLLFRETDSLAVSG